MNLSYFFRNVPVPMVISMLPVGISMCNGDIEQGGGGTL